MAISAKLSASGYSLSPLSEKINVPFSPYSQSGTHITKNADTSFVPGAVFNICSAGLNVFDVEWHAPETNPSASPILTIIIP